MQVAPHLRNSAKCLLDYRQSSKMLRAEVSGRLQNLQKNQENIRNICILAHVDHGGSQICILSLSQAIYTTRGQLLRLDWNVCQFPYFRRCLKTWQITAPPTSMCAKVRQSHYCILLHVHVFILHTRTYTGKTTLADSLVASNGIISQRQAGKVSQLCNIDIVL